METRKIKMILKGADKDWQGKVLRKRTIVFEDDTNGELTLFPDNPEPEVGQDLEFEMVDNGYGNEIKMKKTGGGGGGGFSKRTPHDLATLNSNAIIKSMIESQQVKLADWKQHYVETYKFFASFEENMKNDDMPF